MKHASFFSGIGGFDLAAEWMGWENVFHCEKDIFCQQVLKYYWPDARLYGDIKETDFTIWRGTVDVLSGGFPCQPFSQAGKRKGTDDDRYLWPEMLRGIKEIQPRWIVGENVYGIINWSKGMVFDKVQSDLESAGYEVWAYVLPACGVNAPHRRKRVWFIAHACCEFGPLSIQQRGQKSPKDIDVNRIIEGGIIANTEGKRLSKRNEKQIQIKPYAAIERYDSALGWEDFPTQSPVYSRNDGLPAGLVGITLPKHRRESIKGYGNAIVPKEALQIFKTIEQYETNTTKS